MWWTLKSMDQDDNINDLLSGGLLERKLLSGEIRWPILGSGEDLLIEYGSLRVVRNKILILDIETWIYRMLFLSQLRRDLMECVTSILRLECTKIIRLD